MSLKHEPASEPLHRGGSSAHHSLRNVKRFQGGLVFKAHRLVYQSTLSLRVIRERERDAQLMSDSSLIRLCVVWTEP